MTAEINQQPIVPGPASHGVFSFIRHMSRTERLLFLVTTSAFGTIYIWFRILVPAPLFVQIALFAFLGAFPTLRVFQDVHSCWHPESTESTVHGMLKSNLRFAVVIHVSLAFAAFCIR